MTPKLLLADDSVTIQRVIELTFADEDVQVVAVGDGQQAIDRLRSDRPDIVLADVGMPERDGYDVAAFIKADPSLSHIPVLLLTGAFEPIDEVRARAVGCDGVLVKPFEPQMVISRVRDLLAGNRTSAQPGTETAEISQASWPAAAAAAAPAAEEPGTSLEDYFDRLDAALASKNPSAPPPTLQPAVPMPAAAQAPVQPRPAAPVPVAPQPVPARAAMPAPSRSAAAPPPAAAIPAPAPGDLDLTGWDPSAPSVPVQPVPPAGTPPVAMSAGPEASPAAAAPVSEPFWHPPALQDAFSALLAAEQGQIFISAPRLDPASPDVIDEIVRKVIARLGDDTMRAAVLDVAERLVREEIDRIKNTR